jgi:hypothetical protein
MAGRLRHALSRRLEHRGWYLTSDEGPAVRHKATAEALCADQPKPYTLNVEKGDILSEGTLRTSDLIAAFLDYLVDRRPADACILVSAFLFECQCSDASDRGLDLLLSADALDKWLDEKDDDQRAASNIYVLTETLLGTIGASAPEGCWLSASEGDGALFGIWGPEEDEGD